MSDKATVLALIKENKDILFGKDSENYQFRVETWQKIYKIGCAEGVLDSSKGWRYFRNTVWQNWKKRSLRRALNNNLDELDQTVLEIVGCDPSSTGDPESSETIAQNTRSNQSMPENKEDKTKPSMKDASTSSIFSDHEQEHAKTLQDLQLEISSTRLAILKREAYLRDIEIFLHEKKHGLPMSKFTEQFYSDKLENQNVKVIKRDPASPENIYNMEDALENMERMECTNIMQDLEDDGVLENPRCILHRSILNHF